MPNCQFPNCKNFTRDIYCIGHEKMMGKEKPKEDKPYTIPKKSAKKKIEDKEVKKIVAAIKKVSNRCQIKSPVCTGFIQGADHTQKISPKNSTNKKNIKGACNACNLYKEQHPKWAEKNGHAVSRFDKEFLNEHDLC